MPPRSSHVLSSNLDAAVFMFPRSRRKGKPAYYEDVHGHRNPDEDVEGSAIMCEDEIDSDAGCGHSADGECTCPERHDQLGEKFKSAPVKPKKNIKSKAVPRMAARTNYIREYDGLSNTGEIEKLKDIKTEETGEQHLTQDQLQDVMTGRKTGDTMAGSSRDYRAFEEFTSGGDSQSSDGLRTNPLDGIEDAILPVDDEDNQEAAPTCPAMEQAEKPRLLAKSPRRMFSKTQLPVLELYSSSQVGDEDETAVNLDDPNLMAGIIAPLTPSKHLAKKVSTMGQSSPATRLSQQQLRLEMLDASRQRTVNEAESQDHLPILLDDDEAGSLLDDSTALNPESTSNMQDDPPTEVEATSARATRKRGRRSREDKLMLEAQASDRAKHARQFKRSCSMTPKSETRDSTSPLFERPKTRSQDEPQKTTSKGVSLRSGSTPTAQRDLHSAMMSARAVSVKSMTKSRRKGSPSIGKSSLRSASKYVVAGSPLIGSPGVKKKTKHLIYGAKRRESRKGVSFRSPKKENSMDEMDDEDSTSVDLVWIRGLDRVIINDAVDKSRYENMDIDD